MDNYTFELQINTTPQKLYEALTTQKGLISWWTTKIDIYTHVGGIVTIRFSEKVYIVMKITKLLPHKEVVWKCVEQYLSIEGTDKTDEWLGTTVKFSIKENKDNTVSIVLLHTGLTPQLDCFQNSKESWDFFLQSLKDYLEKGKGHPVY